MFIQASNILQNLSPLRIKKSQKKKKKEMFAEKVTRRSRKQETPNILHSYLVATRFAVINPEFPCYVSGHEQQNPSGL